MNHHQLAILSLLVYRIEPELEKSWRDNIEQRLRERGFELRVIVERRDTQAIVVHEIEEPDNVAIVFRGSEPLRGDDISTCLDALPTQDINGYVHAGFAQSLNYVFFELRNHLDDSDHVYLTGHSMGGALATIMATRIIRDCKIGGVVTFGSPPCLRPELARMLTRLLNGSCVRYESADIVTMLLSTVYRSAGKLNYIRVDGSVIERAAMYVAWMDRLGLLWKSLSDRWRAIMRGQWVSAFMMPRLVTGHSMRRYEESLRSFL